MNRVITLWRKYVLSNNNQVSLPHKLLVAFNDRVNFAL